MNAPRAVVAAALFATAYTPARSAHAQPPVAHDAVAAEAAFSEARALIRQGNHAEACPKLELSFTLDPALGTLLNLGDCFEQTGRTASAWVRYRDAAAMAVQQNQREREVIARERIAALEPRLCRLVVRTSDARPDLEVLRDGAPIARAALGLPVPVDPGAHVIEAIAPGTKRFSTRVEVQPAAKDAACAQTFVDIPALAEADPTGAPVARAPGPVDLTPDPAPAPVGSRWGPMHTIALVAAAGGLVAVGVGSVFALNAASTNSDAESGCTPAGCSSEARTLLADAGRSADVATVTFVIGAALVATGTILWLASPSLRTPASALTSLRTGVRF